MKELCWEFQAVLERGVLNYFSSRADSTVSSNKRQDYKYLDSARVTPLTTDLASFVVHFNDGAVHRLSVLNNGENGQVERQVIFCLCFCEQPLPNTQCNYNTTRHCRYKRRVSAESGPSSREVLLRSLIGKPRGTKTFHHALTIRVRLGMGEEIWITIQPHRETRRCQR